MTKIWVAAVLGIAASVPARAAEVEKPSATFAEVLTRVVSRDPASGAITGVRLKDDAPHGWKGPLTFSMSERSGEVSIEMGRHMMVRDVYESYRLEVDSSMRAELAKLKLKRQLDAAKELKLQQERAARIEKLSGGKLRQGMTKDEVIAAWGQPTEVPDNSMIQEAGRFYLYYGKYHLNFRGILQDMTEAK